MEEVPCYEKLAPQKARKDRLVWGVLIGGGLPVFSAIESISKSSANNVSIWPRIELDLQGGAEHSFSGGNMIPLPTLDLLKYC